jgi:hypothetical protein
MLYRIRVELQKAKTEILSYEKIIKVLQEELSNKELYSTSQNHRNKKITLVTSLMFNQ